MKKHILIIGILLLTGCAKRTYQLNSGKITKKINNLIDSVGQQKTVITDKSVTTIQKLLDTTIFVKGSPLSGYIIATGLRDSDVTFHFENEDLTLDLSTNHNLIKALATPKIRRINLKINDKITVNNNINTTTIEKSKLKINTGLKTDSLFKHEITHSDPIISGGILGGIIKWGGIIIIILALLFYFGRRLISI